MPSFLRAGGMHRADEGLAILRARPLADDIMCRVEGSRRKCHIADFTGGAMLRHSPSRDRRPLLAPTFPFLPEIRIMDRPLLKSSRFEIVVIALLAVVMLVTRTHSLNALLHVPDTSLASFFVLGYFVRRPVAFVGLFLLGYGIDVVTIYGMGGSDFCFTPAYAFMVPAYAAMWFAGRFAAARFGERLSALPAIVLLLVAAAFVSHLFSSGGFYFLSGRFDDPTISEFLPRIERYFPNKLTATLLWAGIAAVAYAIAQMALPEFRKARAK